MMIFRNTTIQEFTLVVSLFFTLPQGGISTEQCSLCGPIVGISGIVLSSHNSAVIFNDSNEDVWLSKCLSDSLQCKAYVVVIVSSSNLDPHYYLCIR